MLWEMRGCDGNLSGWNGSHGSGDSTRGSCAAKSLKAGAYVVNSNSWAGGFNGYCQVVGDSNRQDFALQSSSSHYRSKRPSIPVVWQRQPAYSNESLSYYPVNHVNVSDTQSVLRDKHPSNLVNSANFRIRQNSGGFPAQPSRTEGFRNSVPAQEFGSDLSVDGSNLSNIYQGMVVRVNVPEVYSEVGENIGSVKENGSVVAYRQKPPKIDHYKQENQNIIGQEVYGGPVHVETYRRINDWLQNCQQFSNDALPSSHSTKSVYSSPRVDHPNIEKINQQKVVPASKPSYGVSIQSGAASTFGISQEPRIVAGLESKINKTKGSANYSSSDQQRSSCVVSTEHRNLVYKCEGSRSRAPEAEGSHISNFSYVAQQCRTAFKCDLNPSPSEWSSETLSITGSDKSSYCTDFTPFELGKGVALQTPSQKSTSEFEQRYSSMKSKSTFVSQIPNDAKAHTRNDARKKEEFAQISRRQLQSSNVNGKSNGRFEGHRRLDNFEPKFEQHENLGKNSEDEKRKPRITKTNLPARNSLAPAVNATADNGQNSQFEFSEYDDSAQFVTEIENRPKYRQHQTVMHPENTRKIREGGVRGDKSAEVFISVAKLDRKEGNRPLGSEFERPRSLNIYTDRNQPLSLVRDDVSKRHVNEVRRESNSRPVTQIKNGSLSITIRPTYPTAFDVFNNPKNSKDSLHVKDQFSQKGIGTRSSEAVVLRDVIRKPSETLATFKNTETAPFDQRSVSRYSSASSQASEELDDYTGTFIQADIPPKVAPPAVKSECSTKVEYRRNRSAKADMPSFLVNAPDRFEKAASEKLRAPIASEFDRHANCQDIELHEFQHSPQVDEYQKPESRSSTVLSSGSSSSKIQTAKKISAFKRIFKKARSYINERLGDGSSDYDHEFKINRIGGFQGEESKAMPQTTHLDLSAASSAGRPKSHCQHTEYFEANQISVPNPIADNQVAPNVHSYCEDQDRVNDLLQTPVYESSHLQIDPLKSGNNVLVTKFGNETSCSVDTSLVSEQADHHQDLSDFNDSAKPQFQTLGPSSQLTLEPTFVEDLSNQALRQLPVIDYSEEYRNACSASKQSQYLEISESSHNELTKMQEICTLNDSKVIPAEESQVLDPAIFSHNFTQGYGELEDNECCDDAFEPDSVSLVSEVLKAFDDIQRKGRDLLDSENKDQRSEAERRKGDDDAFPKEEKSKDINEAMACQEYVEFHEDLVIEPPMSFSDFTITL